MNEAQILEALTIAVATGAPAEERNRLRSMLLDLPVTHTFTEPRFINYANLAKRGDAEERLLIRAERMTMDY